MAKLPWKRGRGGGGGGGIKMIHTLTPSGFGYR